MGGISGPSDSRNRKMYEQEYLHGAELFQKALNQYHASSNPYQQKEFKDVMDQAMSVLNETARGLMRKELDKKNEKIAKDYQNFQKHPDDPHFFDVLNQDLNDAKKSIS